MVSRGNVTPLLGLLLALLVMPTPATAQPGSVEGDVYLLMKSGDTKKGSGRSVRLVQESPAFVAARVAACQKFMGPALARFATIQDIRARVSKVTELSELDSVRTLLLATAKADSLAEAEVSASLTAAIALGTVAETGSGMAAHYRFPGLKAGAYALYSSWDIGDNEYRWWAPVALKAGQALIRDLDNSVEVAQGGSPTKALCRVFGVSGN